MPVPRLLRDMILMACLCACSPFEYSPTSLQHVPRGLNAASLERLASAGPGDRIRFALISDTHAWYDELGDVVDRINADSTLDFIICVGDVTQFGYAWEWHRFAGLFARLERPGLVVIGNHDQQADGAAIYADMYGPTDFAFNFRGTRFILFNDNRRDAGEGIPDFPWLDRQIAAAGDSLRICTIAHAPPYSDQLDSGASARMVGMFSRAKVGLSVHAHNHHYAFGEPYGDGVPYLLLESLRDRRYAIAELSGAGVKIERARF